MQGTIRWLLVPMAWIAIAAVALALATGWIDARRDRAGAGPELQSEIFELTGEIISTSREIGNNIRRLDEEGLVEAQRLYDEEMVPQLAEWDSRSLYFRNRTAALYGPEAAGTISSEADRDLDLSDCNILIDRNRGYTAGQCQRDREREATAARHVVRSGETSEAPEHFLIPRAFSGNLFVVNHLFIRYFQCASRHAQDYEDTADDRCGDMAFLRRMIFARLDILGLKRAAIADTILESGS